MSESFESGKKNHLEHQNDALPDPYARFGVRTMPELYALYFQEDQKLMDSKGWDYQDPALLTNQIKDAMEQVDLANASDEERNEREQILWLWYHHAIPVAVFRYKDKEAARAFAQQALEHQTPDNPNRITELWSLLLNDRPEEAEKWVQEIPERERNTALAVLNGYRQLNL